MGAGFHMGTAPQESRLGGGRSYEVWQAGKRTMETANHQGTPKPIKLRERVSRENTEGTGEKA